MIEVILETIQMSLVSAQRIVVLKEIDVERYLPIWIGPCEAEAISICLNGVEMSRPLTHDLLVNVLQKLKAELQYIHITELAKNTFYAALIADVGSEEIHIDSRPSDAIAIAVRLGVPIYVEEAVMDAAGVVPESGVIGEVEGQEENLGVFRDFLNTLDENEASQG